MKAVIQRVSEASVTIDGEIKSQIERGYMILLGITHNDQQEDIDWLVRKILNLRIFNDDAGVMNQSLLQVSGAILLISQFTLYANTKKGNRPSYINAAGPDIAIPLYENFIKTIEVQLGKSVSTGTFGADMKVALVNDGPVTIVLDTNNKG